MSRRSKNSYLLFFNSWIIGNRNTSPEQSGPGVNSWLIASSAFPGPVCTRSDGERMIRVMLSHTVNIYQIAPGHTSTLKIRIYLLEKFVIMPFLGDRKTHR